MESNTIERIEIDLYHSMKKYRSADFYKALVSGSYFVEVETKLGWLSKFITAVKP